MKFHNLTRGRGECKFSLHVTVFLEFLPAFCCTNPVVVLLWPRNRGPAQAGRRRTSRNQGGASGSCWRTSTGCMRKIVLLTILAFLGLTTGSGAADQGLTVKGVRYSTYATFTRIVVEVEAAAPYVLTRSGDGKSVMLGPYEGPLIIKTPLPAVHDGVVAGIEAAEEAGRTFLLVRLAGTSVETKDFSLRSPDRIVLDIMKGTAAAATRPKEQAAVVVLDPGHGGRDGGIV